MNFDSSLSEKSNPGFQHISFLLDFSDIHQSMGHVCSSACTSVFVLVLYVPFPFSFWSSFQKHQRNHGWAFLLRFGMRKDNICRKRPQVPLGCIRIIFLQNHWACDQSEYSWWWTGLRCGTELLIWSNTDQIGVVQMTWKIRWLKHHSLSHSFTMRTLGQPWLYGVPSPAIFQPLTKLGSWR